MDKLFTEKIVAFLKIEKPTDAQIIEGATLLLQCNPSRERGIYNSALRRPQSMLPWIVTDLKKYLGIRKRGLTTADVPQYNERVLKDVRKTLSVVPEGVKVKDDGSIPVLGIRHRRADHDQLPEDIQKIWTDNAERWNTMRRVHAQLGVMIAKPGYAPCDGNELCFQLGEMDKAQRKAFERYDKFQLSKPTAQPDSAEVFTDNVKTVQNARTIVSRGLSRKTQTDESLQKIQNAVDTLFALKQAIKPETVAKLKAIGITIPQG